MKISELIAGGVAGLLLLGLVLALCFGGLYLLTLVACYAAAGLGHPLPFWPVFAAIFVISAILKPSSSKS